MRKYFQIVGKMVLKFEKFYRFFRLLCVFIPLLCGLTVCILYTYEYTFRRQIVKWLDPNTAPFFIYKASTDIPAAPRGKLWPEELLMYEHPLVDIREMADPKYSTIRVEGRPDALLGNTIHVTIVLFDGFKRRKKKGGDLIRVWMKEPRLKASANAKVVDNNDGSYTAFLTAFWEGQPEIVAAIISPREVRAFAFKRRYKSPPVFMNTAVFEHPLVKSIVEETPCNYDHHVPGYDVICDLTAENYGIPWYCGKPGEFRLSCADWTMVGGRNLWELGIEQQQLSPLELDLLSINRKTMVLDQRIQMGIKHATETLITKPEVTCKKLSPSETWIKGFPSGFLYDGKWKSNYCHRKPDFTDTIHQCLKNTNVFTIGDSTQRQMFLAFQKLVPCKLVTESWSRAGKHRPVTCVNFSLNYTLTYGLHQLPFCSQDTPRQYFKPFRAYTEEISRQGRTVVILNIYAHFLNYHSHVIFETLLRLRNDISDMLDKYPNMTVIIKGPHAFSFSRVPASVLWMPDSYASVYQEYLFEIFHDLQDRVIYLDAFDITVSSEQWHIHSEDYIIDELVRNVLGFIC